MPWSKDSLLNKWHGNWPHTRKEEDEKDKDGEREEKNLDTDLTPFTKKSLKMEPDLPVKHKTKNRR